jgi:8-oxo-dGTP pyrophosphatase MutT (NUDIX family)
MGQADARVLTAPAGPRDAATIILVRDPQEAPRILMGKRGSKAAFMPSKYVFPGGALDYEDAEVPLARPMSGLCAGRLAEQAGPVPAAAFAAAAIRELWEETGLLLGVPGAWPGTPPAGWASFAATGHLPSPAALAYVFRAVTPKGRTRRFDARFFVADARHVAGDLDDFSRGEDELSDLAWLGLEQAAALDLPFITEVVLAEIAARLPDIGPPPDVPFFRNEDELNEIERLGGTRPLAARA